MNTRVHKPTIVLLAVAAIIATASPFKFWRSCEPLKVSVDGVGHLRLSRDGRAVYAKSATLTVDPSGKIATASGDTILPTISAPTDTQSLTVDLEGNVSAVRGSVKTNVGRLVLAIFPDNATLIEKDGVLSAADRPKLGNPGEDTNGVIRMAAVPAKAKEAIQIKSAAPIRIEPKAGMLPAVHDAAAKPVLQPVPKLVGGKIVALASAEVEGEKVLLGDIATIDVDASIADSLKQVELADAPILGAKRTIDRARILAKIKAAGFQADKLELIVPATVEVKRKGQAITQSQFNYAAMKALYESAGIATEYTPADEIGPDFLAPAGKFALVAETLAGVNAAVATVKVAVYVGTTRINSRTVKLNAKSLPATVKAGTTVKVIFKSGGATVEVDGVAKTTGKVGDTISVEVKVAGATDKSTHSGTLLPSGAVEVKL